MHKHHRKLRSQGGGDEPVNIMHVTPEFHDYIHANPNESYANGWLVKSWDEPNLQPCRGYRAYPDGWHKIESAPVAGEPSETGAEGADAAQGEPVPCPRCKGTGKVPPAPSQPLPKRHRVTLGIRLPKDAAENGIEVLETLFSAARDELKEERGWSDTVAVYYVIADVFYEWLTWRATKKT